MEGRHDGTLVQTNLAAPSGTWNNAPVDTQLQTGCEQTLQRTAEYCSNFETYEVGSSDSLSPVSESRQSSQATSEISNVIHDKVERRREQNRASQRAYRDRKEKHQRELEAQIAQW